jgi:hypothetical protein
MVRPVLRTSIAHLKRNNIFRVWLNHLRETTVVNGFVRREKIVEALFVSWRQYARSPRRRIGSPTAITSSTLGAMLPELALRRC